MSAQHSRATKEVGESEASRSAPATAAGDRIGVSNQVMQQHLLGGVSRAELGVGRADNPPVASDRRSLHTPIGGLGGGFGVYPLGRRNDPAEEEANRVAARLTARDIASHSFDSRPYAAGAAKSAGSQTGSSLPASLRFRFEQRLGADLSPIRLHRGPEAAAAASAIGAMAFAHGPDIALAANAPEPETGPGEQLLAHEVAHSLQPDSGSIIRRQPADSPSPQRSLGSDAAAAQSAPGGNPVAPQAAGPPVYWGFDISKQPRAYYVSIPPPSRRLDEVATFIYGSASAAADLRGANPGVLDMIPGGTVLHLPPGTLSSAAQASLNQSLESGLVMRTTGIPESQAAEPDVMMHHLTIGSQTYDLLEGQFQGLLRGIAWHLGIKADYYKGMCEVYLDTRNDHVENTNSWVRGVSDWAGDVSVPEESVYTGPRDRAQAIMAELALGQPSIELVIKASRELRGVAEDYYAGERAWNHYINGTIHGAEVTASRLETVRNTCFAVEAGLAGAVVAPVAFAAAGTGLAAVGVTGTTATVLAGGAAIGAGAVAGGGLRGGLEVALPGMQADQPASQRFVSGFKSGALQGAIGAAGALAAPAVSGAIAPRLGIAADVAPTAAQRLALGASTGVVMGAPSGAIYSAADKAADWVSGRMSTTDYLASIGTGAAGGAIGGGVFGLVPINGLYRSGGPIPGFTGEPVMPRWMLAGPYSPLQANWSPPAEFNALSATELRPLPEGYGWARIGDVWEPINLTGPNRMPLTLRAYGPDQAGRTNYNILTGRELVQSSAVTRAQGATYPAGNRNYPMTTADYVEPTSGQQFIRGHNIDYAETIDTPGAADSNIDPLNYTPEPSWWGLYLRNNLVNRIIRPTGGGYRQMNFYSGTPRTTANGTPIPDGVYFVQTNQAGVAVRAWRIPFNATGPRQLAQLPQFEVPLPSVPAGLLSPAPAPSPAGAGAVGGSQASARRQ
jgi:hypothetical protein